MMISVEIPISANGAPKRGNWPTPLASLPDIMLDAHQHLLAMLPLGVPDDGEFSLVKAILDGENVRLVFELEDWRNRL